MRLAIAAVLVSLLACAAATLPAPATAPVPRSTAAPASAKATAAAAAPAALQLDACNRGGLGSKQQLASMTLDVAKVRACEGCCERARASAAQLPLRAGSWVSLRRAVCHLSPSTHSAAPLASTLRPHSAAASRRGRQQRCRAHAARQSAAGQLCC